jgi:hypothetical protein
MSQSDYDKWVRDQKSGSTSGSAESQTFQTTDLATSASNLFSTPIRGSDQP